MHPKKSDNFGVHIIFRHSPYFSGCARARQKVVGIFSLSSLSSSAVYFIKRFFSSYRVVFGIQKTAGGGLFLPLFLYIGFLKLEKPL